jgi:hypothetical protein
MTKNTAYITYLIYVLVFEIVVFGGIGYAVFVLNHNGWWMVFAVLVSGCAYSPTKWIHEVTE